MPNESVAIDPYCLLVGEESLVVQCAVMLRDVGVPVRGIVSGAVDVRSMAADEGFESIDASASSLVDAIEASRANVLISAAHLELVPVEALDAVDLALNFHDGPLPNYAGLNVTTWAIENGEAEHGITWHIMEASADTGGILASRSFPIGAEDTAFDLNTRCYEAGLEGFAELGVPARVVPGAIAVGAPAHANKDLVGERVDQQHRDADTDHGGLPL